LLVGTCAVWTEHRAWRATAANFTTEPWHVRRSDMSKRVQGPCTLRSDLGKAVVRARGTRGRRLGKRRSYFDAPELEGSQHHRQHQRPGLAHNVQVLPRAGQSIPPACPIASSTTTSVSYSPSPQGVLNGTARQFLGSRTNAPPIFFNLTAVPSLGRSGGPVRRCRELTPGGKCSASSCDP
jgi:hypothetical protein